VQQWPADKVERWPLDRLVPYARNARTHSDAQVAQIAGSIREWGWTTPVLVDETGMLIAGHGRVLAARKLGLNDIPVMVARGWTEAQKRAYALADNKLALNAGWDLELLKVELTDVKTMGADLGLVGFEDEEARRAVRRSERRPYRSGRRTRTASGAGYDARRYLGSGRASAGLRRLHRHRHGRAGAERHDTRADGHGPALRRGIRPRVAASGRSEPLEASREGHE